VALAEPAVNYAVLTPKTSFPQFTPEVRDMMAALSPTLVPTAGMSVECAGAIHRFRFRRSIRAHSVPDGPAIDVELAGNPQLRHAAPRQFHHLLTKAVAPLPLLLLNEH
jgi:hypothetical protein